MENLANRYYNLPLLKKIQAKGSDEQENGFLFPYFNCEGKKVARAYKGSWKQLENKLKRKQKEGWAIMQTN